MWFMSLNIVHRIAVKVKQFVANQEEHHKKMTFQDEFRLLCQRHGIEIDERHVWN